ncbi:hypothetical protein ACRQ5D_09120 [Mucilaginibacter sp. P25]|uniref:hypothetical protein n=1 Tax=unclassified Mucilaginibacter TaxID=2617802 RepID=UPI003D66CAC2
MADKQQVLNELLGNFAGMSENDVAVSLPYWRTRKIEKGDFFNMQNIVCTDLALINKGLFQIYYVYPETQEEKNIYFFRKGSSWYHSAVLSINTLAHIISRRWRMPRSSPSTIMIFNIFTPRQPAGNLLINSPFIKKMIVLIVDLVAK